jgi:phosphoglycerate-specific signal transduction histidine kinase
MSRLLEEAFGLARALPEERQDALAARIIAELTPEDDFDRKIAETVDQLDWLIEEARADFRAGRTKDLDPDRL